MAKKMKISSIAYQMQAAIQYRKGMGTDTTHWRVGTRPPGGDGAVRGVSIVAMRG
jgi:hypothetical protein